MPNLQHLLNTALELHRARRFPEAEQAYRQVLAQSPANSIAWHHLGLVADAVGDLAAAKACLVRAVELKPQDAEAQYALGLVLQKLGQPAEAAGCYRSALALKPDYAEGYNNLGLALAALGQLDEAVSCHRSAVALRPNEAWAHYNLGNALKEQQKLSEAETYYRQAIALAPDWPEAHSNLGLALTAQQRYAEAADVHRQALKLRPGAAEIHSNLGSTLQKLGKHDEAVECFRQAVNIEPNRIELLFNLGSGTYYQGNTGEAIAAYRRALELEPDHARAHNGLALALHEHGCLEEAERHYRRALALSPDMAEARLNWSLFSLLKGDFAHGWPEYEWRWKRHERPELSFKQPRWRGEPLAGRLILLHYEQGLGDTLQFVRYAAVLKRMGATVMVLCQSALRKILATVPGVDRLVCAGDSAPTFDFHAPLLSLPGILGTTLDSIPADVPYLSADSSLVEHWHQRLRPFAGFRIGIHWQGRPGQGTFRQRDIPLECFKALADIPGVQLISLQKGADTSALSGAGGGSRLIDFGEAVDTESGAFMDTAAIMKNLDLVISSDTSVPHLAGALGVPVWLALPHVPNWRWLLDRPDSPWYPTMRLFRQQEAGDWAGVFEQIQAALGQRQGPAAVEASLDEKHPRTSGS